jgi:polyphosphate glucokinase
MAARITTSRPSKGMSRSGTEKKNSHRPANGTPARSAIPNSILVVDIGGTKVKILATGHTEPRKAPTGREFTPARLVATVKRLSQGWNYDALTIGLPTPVGLHGAQSEPGNLGTGWVGFDFASAFGKPVKIINDAVMQALGSFEHGRMIFLGLGTGVGSALIADNIIVPMEISHFPYDAKRSFNDILCRAGLRKYGKGEWRKAIEKIVPVLMRSFLADYVVLGGGTAKNICELPVGARLGHNLTAFRGGVRLWENGSKWILAMPGNGRDPLGPPEHKIPVDQPFENEAQ